MTHLERISEEGIALDIDETICWTVGKWMEEFMHRLGNPEDLTIKQMADKYQYVEHVPYWKGTQFEELLKELMVNEEFAVEIDAIDGALHYTRLISKIIPIASYKTARTDNLYEGTLRWLRRNGFPDAPLFTRPRAIPHKDKHAWKAELLKQTYPKVRGIIEDNQGIIDALGDDYEGVVFLYGHESHPKESERVIPCKDWETVHNRVVEFPW